MIGMGKRFDRLEIEANPVPLTLKQRIDLIKELAPIIMQNSESINGLLSIPVEASKKELEEIYPRKTQEHVID